MATMPSLDLIATTAFGVEAVTARELTQLGYEPETVGPGRVRFAGGEADICHANLWLRSAGRVLIQLGEFPATDFGVLFDQTRELPWERWIAPDNAFPVRGRSVKSQLSSVPACQRAVKKAVAERLLDAHHADRLPETGGECEIEVSLLKDQVSLPLNTSGPGLHRRG